VAERERIERLAELVPTSALAAAGLIGGFAVATGTGSRPLGGAVMASFGLGAIAVWMRRDGAGTAARLTAVGLGAFVISHLLGLLIGAWPSVLAVSAATAWACWRWSDARWLGRGRLAVGGR
jgi:tetrahydromethanopterin S-methyltransferase subunit C